MKNENFDRFGPFPRKDHNEPISNGISNVSHNVDDTNKEFRPCPGIEHGVPSPHGTRNITYNNMDGTDDHNYMHVVSCPLET